MTRSEKFSTALNLALLATAAIILTHPRGPFRAKPVPGAPATRISHTLGDEGWTALLDAASIAGPDRHRVLVLVFSDYECPACKQTYAELQELLGEDERQTIGYLHYPLPQHPTAATAARAAICAEDQGRFVEMHRYLFESDDWKLRGDWRATAEAVGIPEMERFLDCIPSEETTRRLERHLSFVNQLQVAAIPTWTFREFSISGAAALPQVLDRVSGQN